jgi:hypothetical protein
VLPHSHDSRLQLVTMPKAGCQALPVVDEVGACSVTNQQLAVMAVVHVSALHHWDTAATGCSGVSQTHWLFQFFCNVCRAASRPGALHEQAPSCLQPPILGIPPEISPIDSNGVHKAERRQLVAGAAADPVVECHALAVPAEDCAGDPPQAVHKGLATPLHRCSVRQPAG